MEPHAADVIWMNYVAVSAGLLIYPLTGFYHDHLDGASTNSFWVESQGLSEKFWNAHKVTATPTKHIGPNHPL
jgi:hypothetical protein